MNDIVPWLCWIFPIAGAVSALILAKIDRKVRDLTVVIFSFLGLLMASLMLPELLTFTFVDKPVLWISLPNSKSVGIGMLIDPLSIILANIVSFLSFLIMLYSLKYMEKEPGATRYWFLMSIFISGMLLLVLADNFIFFFVGWKIVGICSYALIGHYYGDEKEHWIGGPSPIPFQKPSRCGLKALVITTFGDVALLAGIIILYIYSGTFNFMEIYQTAGIWLAKIAVTPGMLILTIVLILLGPLAKSAQFPFHEWLPDAMSGPTPVSALIHAATMVKAGVYLVARILPIFFFAYWQANYPEALTFFILTAAIGCFTAFLAGTQAMVSLELKKALAYSTMSQIGYMMLGLGVAGLSSNVLIGGYTAGLYHLLSTGIHKAALFLCAGVIIKTSGSIYMSKMNLSREKIEFTWLFMWIVAFSLIGIPPFTGYWSKDEVLLTCWQSGQYILYAIAWITIAIKSFYTIRFMGLTFHKNKGMNGGARHEKTSILMLTPIGLLALLTILIGLMGPYLTNFLHEGFGRYFTEALNLSINTGSKTLSATPALNPILSNSFLLMDTVLMIVIGAIPAYMFYISHKTDPQNIVNRYKISMWIHKFLLDRWHIDTLYNKVFVNGMLSIRKPLVKFIEDTIDEELNVNIPNLLIVTNKRLKKIQTGILSINLLFILLFLAGILFLFLLLGVL